MVLAKRAVLWSVSQASHSTACTELDIGCWHDPSAAATPGCMPAWRLDDEVLHRLVRARERMHDESNRVLRVTELARQSGLSEQHFVRLFRAAYGCTPGQYLGRLRMREAKRLLAQGTSVTEVCFSVGYTSLGTFSHRFALQTSLSPRAFQRQMRGFGSVAARLVALYVPICFVERWNGAYNVDFGEVSEGRLG
jgi:AraC-like DNA-binding protein